MSAAVYPNYPDLHGKVAVVTGGSKGIGAATCQLLVDNGVRVAVVARERSAIDAEVDALQASGGKAIGVEARCEVWQDLLAMLAEVTARLGPVDILIPFAGGFSSVRGVLETTEAEWRADLDANLTSTFLTVKAFLPGMIERRRGAVVTMASNAGRLLDIPLAASYAAAKAGVITFTRHLALEVGRYGIRANCVAPATTMSPRVEGLMNRQRLSEIAAMSPLGRIGTPLDTAHATVFLVSEAASWLTGVTMDIAGGRVML